MSLIRSKNDSKRRSQRTARSSIRRSIRKTLKANKKGKFKDPTKFNAPDSDEEAWLDELYIKRATVTEITYRIKNNLLRTREYLYQITVLWNIAKETVIFRSYEDFFNMQMHLLDHFGEGASDVDRSIPYLPGRQIWRPSTKKLAKSRSPKIQEYTQKLLDLPYKISRCNEVLNFFRFRDTDPRTVNYPEELVYTKPVTENRGGFLRRSIRRSFKKVKVKLVRTGSLRSFTNSEDERENNDDYDVEPTTNNQADMKKVSMFSDAF